MKKIFLYFSFPLLMLWVALNAHAKASCSDDFRNISKTIRYEHGILTTNTVFVDAVTGSVITGGDGSCGA